MNSLITAYYQNLKLNYLPLLSHLLNFMSIVMFSFYIGKTNADF